MKNVNREKICLECFQDHIDGETRSAFARGVIVIISTFLAAMPPSSSPMRPPPAMYRRNSSSEMEDSDETPRDINDLFRAMKLSGPESVSIEEIRASLQRSLTLDDDDLVNSMANDFFRNVRIKVSREETTANRENSNTDSKENEGRQQQQQQQSYGTPADNPIPAGEPTPRNYDDVTPATTPMSFSTTGAKTPTPSETVRRRGRDRSRSPSTTRSRSRTPMGSFFRSKTPDRSGTTRMRSRSPAPRPRSQSPLLRFFGSNDKPDTPEHPRGAIPNRSGLPPTPVRVNEPETFPAKTTDSYPSTTTTTGNNTFSSPTPSNSSWTTRESSRRQVPMDAAPTTAPQQTMPPPTASPEFHANVQPNVHYAPQPQFNAGAPPVPPANVPPPVHVNNAQAPVPPVHVNMPQDPPVKFNVSLPSKPKGAKRRPGGRRGKDKRPQRAGGPEKSSTQQAVLYYCSTSV